MRGMRCSWLARTLAEPIGNLGALMRTLINKPTYLLPSLLYYIGEALTNILVVTR